MTTPNYVTYTFETNIFGYNTVEELGYKFDDIFHDVVEAFEGGSAMVATAGTDSATFCVTSPLGSKEVETKLVTVLLEQTLEFDELVLVDFQPVTEG